MAESLPECTVCSVWERHPIEGVKEQPVHFVRRRTEFRKEVGALGLEDSYEWHRANADKFMEGEPYDRALLVQCKAHYSHLQEHFPAMKHYWDDPDATFGEQLILEGVTADSLCLGDELQSSYGPLRLKVTCPRLCCFRVDHRYPAIPALKYSGSVGTVRQWCSGNAHAGFMCRVLHPGTVMAGDSFKVERRPYPQYPLSRLAGLVYGKTPLRVDFVGSDDELAELCGLEEDLCHFEWWKPLTEYKNSLAHKRPLHMHESLGKPVSYEEGLELIEARWMSHHALGETPDGCLVEEEMAITVDEEGLLHLEGQHCIGRARNDRGVFAMELDFGGFPHFPRYCFMAQEGVHSVNLVFSSGERWSREPDEIPSPAKSHTASPVRHA